MDHLFAAGEGVMGDESAQCICCPWWPWPLTFKLVWGTKHVFPLNLAQIRSVVPKIFQTQTNKKKVTDSAKNRTSRSSLHAII